jgi:hypothetical protein
MRPRGATRPTPGPDGKSPAARIASTHTRPIARPARVTGRPNAVCIVSRCALPAGWPAAAANTTPTAARVAPSGGRSASSASAGSASRSSRSNSRSAAAPRAAARTTSPNGGRRKRNSSAATCGTFTGSTGSAVPACATARSHARPRRRKGGKAHVARPALTPPKRPKRPRSHQKPRSDRKKRPDQASGKSADRLSASQVSTSRATSASLPRTAPSAGLPSTSRSGGFGASTMVRIASAARTGSPGCLPS